jgi:cysteine synthase A
MNMSAASQTVYEVKEKINGLKNLIGNTPLLSIRFLYQGEARVVYAKAESFNMTGSIKDRMAWYIIKQAYEEERINPGDTIVEATSGNTGISFAAIGRALGHPVAICMPDWMSQERVSLIRSFGATIFPVSDKQGGFVGSIEMTEDIAQHFSKVFLPCQFSNDANVEAHYQTTGPEIWHQLASVNLSADAFVAGVGTGGTIMGVGKLLCEKNQNIRLHAVEPAESPTLSTGHKVGHHRIQGISDEFIPAIVKLDQLDKIISVHDGDAILMAQKLASDLGLAVGISSGANFIAALIAQNELDHQSVVATVFADSNKKYLSTDLLRKEPVKEEYLSPQIQLTGFEVIGRLNEI